MASKIVLNEDTRRWLRTTVQVLLSLVVILPGVLELLKTHSVDLGFDESSWVYGKIIIGGAVATAFTSAFVRLYLALESKGWLPSWLIVAKTNHPDAEPVAIVTTDSAGTIQNVQIASAENVPAGKHEAPEVAPQIPPGV